MRRWAAGLPLGNLRHTAWLGRGGAQYVLAMAFLLMAIALYTIGVALITWWVVDRCRDDLSAGTEGEPSSTGARDRRGPGSLDSR